MPNDFDDVMADMFVSPIMAFACLKAFAAGGGCLPPNSSWGT